MSLRDCSEVSTDGIPIWHNHSHPDGCRSIWCCPQKLCSSVHIPYYAGLEQNAVETVMRQWRNDTPGTAGDKRAIADLFSDLQLHIEEEEVPIEIRAILELSLVVILEMNGLKQQMHF